MAAQTRLLARSGLGVVVLNWDDATLLASGCTIANTSGTYPIVFYIVLDGTNISRTVGIGQSSVLNFPTSHAVTLGTASNGASTLTVTGLSEYGIGSA